MLGLSTAAAASVIAAVLIVPVARRNRPHPPRRHALRPPPASRPRRPTVVATPPTAATTPPPAGQANLARLLPRRVQGRPEALREFHDLPDGDGSTAAQLKAAITEMLDGRTAYDPDYSSQWPASASVRSVTVSGTVATVDLAGQP